MDKSFDHIDQLAYHINQDGSVDLEQDLGAGNIERVFLHRLHLRLLFEEAGHLLPPPPADELSKSLAGKLVEVLNELCDEQGRSPGIDRVIDRLSAVVDMLPDTLFQQNQREAQASDRPDFELTRPHEENMK